MVRLPLFFFFVAAQGLSGRIGHVLAVEGQPLVVRVELEDPACSQAQNGRCLLDLVGQVIVDMRPLGQLEWHTAKAVQEENPSWWHATFTSSVVPARNDPEHAARIEVKARVLGARGGVMLDIGGDQPLEAEVFRPREARALERILLQNADKAAEAEAFELVGHVGTDARAGTSARVRAFVGVGGRASTRTEVVVLVSVGPQFARPARLEGGGPIELGFEGGVRLYARDPAGGSIALFLEPDLSLDARFPGLDPGIGLRAGGALRMSSDIAIEAAIGGSFVAFRAFDGEHSTIGGASGGIRVALRFGGARENR
jgi:hypothetical protein